MTINISEEISEELSGISHQDSPPTSVSLKTTLFEGEKAGLASRFFALVVDYIVLELFIAIGTSPLKERLLEIGFSALDWFDPMEADQWEFFLSLFSFYILAGVVFWGFYFTFFHWASGQTFGKKIMKIKVVKVDGSSVGMGDAFVRWVGLMLGFFMLGLGLLWAVFNKNKRCWHDKMAGTIVVKGE